MAQITYKDDPVAYSMHQKIGYTTLYYPLIVHGKFNNRWKHGVDCGVNTGSYSIVYACLLYTSPSPRDRTRSRMPSSA